MIQSRGESKAQLLFGRCASSPLRYSVSVPSLLRLYSRSSNNSFVTCACSDMALFFRPISRSISPSFHRTPSDLSQLTASLPHRRRSVLTPLQSLSGSSVDAYTILSMFSRVLALSCAKRRIDIFGKGFIKYIPSSQTSITRPPPISTEPLKIFELPLIRDEVPLHGSLLPKSQISLCLKLRQTRVSMGLLRPP